MTFDESEEREQLNTYGYLGVNGCDGILQLLVAATDRSGAEIPITLNVKGTIVTGILISEKAFFLELSQRLTSKQLDFGSPNSVLEEIFGGFAESIAKNNDREKAEDVPLGQPLFINLKNANFILSSNDIIPVNDSLLWRGRLDMVDGFTFGKFTAFDQL
jgi:hypothetical protein